MDPLIIGSDSSRWALRQTVIVLLSREFVRSCHVSFSAIIVRSFFGTMTCSFSFGGAKEVPRASYLTVASSSLPSQLALATGSSATVGPSKRGSILMERTDESEPLKVTFSGPAKHFTDAAPIGNGRLGAMVWGGVASELLQLNEDTLWTGTPGNYTDPHVPAALVHVRKLVDDGEYADATAAAVNLLGNPSEAYQLLGDLKLDFDDLHLTYTEQTYSRELDLDTATVRVGYYVGNVGFSREYFSSYPDQVIVMKISASKSGCVSFTVSLDSQLHYRSYVKGSSQIIMEGACPGKRIPPEVNDSDPKGIQFCSILDLKISEENGMVSVLDDKKLKVEASDWAILRLVAASSFDGPLTNPIDSKKDPTADAVHALKSIQNLSYLELYARHLSDYQNLFRRVSLKLRKSSSSSSAMGRASLATSEPSSITGLCNKENETGKISTADRIKSFAIDEDPFLVELLFQFGRYLLISCSRPGTQVANLQGIWNKDIAPKWDSAPHLNINLEMNYWPCLPCNLAECQEALFDFLSSLSVNGSKTAEVNYGARGWVIHHKTDIWAKSSPVSGEVVWAMWAMGGAWLCTHLWEHYKYTMDKEFLMDKAYPLLEGCALFLLDWLIEGPDGYLETNPSTSPEHSFIAPDGRPASVSYSTTMDMAIIKEVFSGVVAAAEVLGYSNGDLVNKVRKAQTRLRPIKLAMDGSIMEWAQDFKDPEIHHRHLSHLFGLFPGHTITLELTPDLCTAAAKSLYKRGEDGPGWSTTWKIALWARLYSSEHAYRMVKHLITLVDPDHEVSFHGGLYSNLFAAHPPFQIDANFGFIAAVSEMLVQSTVKDLYLLPALPRDKWGNGWVKGLKARGGVTVNIRWSDGDLNEVDVWSKDWISLHKLHYKGTSVTVDIASHTVYTFDGRLRLMKTCSL
ncbi:alpha-L-fucosidase 2-like isoform X2 [Rhodamnia argentea]|uniref:Alpha-L-fucosidase 2-like isoform X2 n=1 Tax=Rhodamnia argentea TaxID=178133 RepID=A0A8B8NJV9_9MYRT|nr:alpha-L-fucosidase 2-like isoform X2 [Rhodamnia argentea]